MGRIYAVSRDMEEQAIVSLNFVPGWEYDPQKIPDTVDPKEMAAPRVRNGHGGCPSIAAWLIDFFWRGHPCPDRSFVVELEINTCLSVPVSRRMESIDNPETFHPCAAQMHPHDCINLPAALVKPYLRGVIEPLPFLAEVLQGMFEILTADLVVGSSGDRENTRAVSLDHLAQAGLSVAMRFVGMEALDAVSALRVNDAKIDGMLILYLLVGIVDNSDSCSDWYARDMGLHSARRMWWGPRVGMNGKALIDTTKMCIVSVARQQVLHLGQPMVHRDVDDLMGGLAGLGV
jgi:hypothetical protein